MIVSLGSTDVLEPLTSTGVCVLVSNKFSTRFHQYISSNFLLTFNSSDKQKINFPFMIKFVSKNVPDFLL